MLRISIPAISIFHHVLDYVYISDGYMPLNKQVLNITILNSIYSFMKDGHYRPQNCTAVQKVAIVVPYRYRQRQLQVFLNNVIPRIHQQQLEYVIYVIEQVRFLKINKTK